MDGAKGDEFRELKKNSTQRVFALYLYDHVKTWMSNLLEACMDC